MFAKFENWIMVKSWEVRIFWDSELSGNNFWISKYFYPNEYMYMFTKIEMI